MRLHELPKNATFFVYLLLKLPLTEPVKSNDLRKMRVANDPA